MQTIVFIIIAIAQVGVLVWYFTSSRAKNKKIAAHKNAIAKEYPYEGMRNIALNAVPGAILANLSADEIVVYSVLMDWDMGADMITLAVQVTGEANLYVKSGGGIIGAGRYQNISAAAQKLVATAQGFLQITNPVANTALPGMNTVQFYLLTNRGKLMAADEMKNIENRSSPITPLFEEANNVIAEMRKTALADHL